MRIPLPMVHRRPRIEIIPLIDIVFFLLATFVMVSLSMVKNQGILVRLPAASASAPQERRVSATISLTEHGDVYLDKQPVTLEELVTRLGELQAREPELQVVINGDQQVFFGRAVEILDRVRRLGITKVSIQTTKP